MIVTFYCTNGYVNIIYLNLLQRVTYICSPYTYIHANDVHLLICIHAYKFLTTRGLRRRELLMKEEVKNLLTEALQRTEEFF